MGYGMKDWQITLDGMPIGTLGDAQFMDAVPDQAWVGGVTDFPEMTINCTLKGGSFKKIAAALGLKPAWLEYAHEWSAKCGALSVNLRTGGRDDSYSKRPVRRVWQNYF